MALNGQEIWYFMSVGTSSTPIPDQSFEVRHPRFPHVWRISLMPGKELRIKDYLKAYKTTGRPPLPCPQSPDTPNARTALGLAPLFVPAAIPIPPDNLNSASSTSDAPATIPSDLPANHEFRSTKTPTGEHLESISAQTLYNHFSHEVGFLSR
ncbi:hypothetical protein J3R83DRAFT_2496 [Lanmaoa asiatica]|nr:hypothetical protein J3R83DRAFT_2496 [Lanmaoa asiatica]